MINGSAPLLNQGTLSKQKSPMLSISKLFKEKRAVLLLLVGILELLAERVINVPGRLLGRVESGPTIRVQGDAVCRSERQVRVREEMAPERDGDFVAALPPLVDGFHG